MEITGGVCSGDVHNLRKNEKFSNFTFDGKTLAESGTNLAPVGVATCQLLRYYFNFEHAIALKLSHKVDTE